MKRSVLCIIFTCIAFIANAQKFALIDMEYILENIPAYERANQQLDQMSQEWQKEVEVLVQQAQTLYKEYQSKAASF
ncbi:hypothetical protein EZS27_040342, partial [termite gut metagenome]